MREGLQQVRRGTKLMHWTRANGAWKSRHFVAKEFNCTCGVCHSQVISDDLVEDLDCVREEVGIPVVVTSGYRCRKRQDDLRKQGYETAAGISSHEMGLAADITLRCEDHSPENWDRLRAAVLKQFAQHSVGEAKSFFHVDRRPNGPRRWTYNKL